jgi:hypothetical protein
MSTLAEYTPWITIIGSALGSIITVATLIFRRLGKQDEEILKLRLELIEESKKRLIHETQFNLFWEFFKKEAPKVLMSHHTPEIDALLSKMKHQELTDEEKERFIEYAEEILDRNYDLPYVTDKDIGTYATLKSAFQMELKGKHKAKEIDAEYEEQKRKLQDEYEQKKQRRKFAFWR